MSLESIFLITGSSSLKMSSLIDVSSLDCIHLKESFASFLDSLEGVFNVVIDIPIGLH